MSFSEESSYGGTDSEEENSEYVGSANQPVAQPVRHNKVTELFHDNQGLQGIIRKSCADLLVRQPQMMSFYLKLKESCRSLKEAYEESQRMVTELKVEKLDLRRELAARSMQALNLNQKSETNGVVNLTDSEQYEADFQDTVKLLKKQLRKSEDDKQRVLQTFQAERLHWQGEFSRLQEHWFARENQWKKYVNDMKEAFEQNGYQNQLQHYKELTDMEQLYRENEQTLKTQVTMVLKDADKYKNDLADKENLISALQTKVQKNETRILTLSKDLKVEKEREMSLRGRESSLKDQIVQLEKDIDRVNLQRREKETRYDQVYKMYNDEHAVKERLQAMLRNRSEERDKVYAQYLCAEESLKKKTDEITELNRRLGEAESHTSLSVYKEQAAIFKNDFEMEREARQKVHQECESMKVMVGQYQIEMQRMKQELMKYHQLFHNRTGVHPT